MTRKRLDQFCEKGIIALVGGIVVFGPLATGAVRPMDFLTIQALTALALTLWILRFWLNKNHRLLFPPVCWAMLAFVGLAWFRYHGADLEYVARREFLKILVYAALFLLVVNNLHKQETTQLVSLLLLAVATLLSLYAIYQWVGQSEYVWHFRKPAQYIGRGSGSYICPNHLAGFLELVAPLGIAFLFAGRYNYTFKVFLGYGCIVILAGIAVTMSRGGWLAIGAALALFFLLLLRKRQYRIPALAALLMLAATTTIVYQKSDKLQNRLQKMREGGSAAFIGTRPAIWKAAWKMWQDNKIWGVGPGHFDYHFHQYRPQEIQARPGRVHNDYLNLLVDWGIIGASLAGIGGLLLVGGLIQTQKYVNRASKDIGANRNSNRSAFLLGSLCSALALSVHSFFDFNLHVPANASVAVVILALAASHLRFTSARHWVNDRPGLKTAYTVPLAAIVVFLIVNGFQSAREQWHLLRAEAAETRREQMERMKKAAQIEPRNFETLYNIGESLKHLGFRSAENAEENLEASILWFQKSSKIHPQFAFNYIGIGMALDRLNRVDEATPYYEEAVKLDPNQHEVLNYMGWHQVNRGDYSAARKYFERSLEIKWWDNHLPLNYLNLLP